ncbi:MAG: hypothetical protein OXR67_07955 [Chloroflexota bacterium]|nr:hypothetical protein [Chloroflexota bacterium]
MATEFSWATSRKQMERIARRQRADEASLMSTGVLADLLSVEWVRVLQPRPSYAPSRLENLIDMAAAQGRMTSWEADYLAVEAVVFEGGGAEAEVYVLVYPAVERVLPGDVAEARRRASLLEQAIGATVLPAVVGVDVSPASGAVDMQDVLFLRYDEQDRRVRSHVPSSAWPRGKDPAVARSVAGSGVEVPPDEMPVEPPDREPAAMQALVGRRHYNNGHAEFILEPVSPSVVRVEHRDQVGWIGINKNWDVLQPFTWTHEESYVDDDGIRGSFLGDDTPEKALRALARNMLSDQRKADSRRVNPEERQNAARQVLREFLGELEG